MSKTSTSHRSGYHLKKSGLEGYYTADEIGEALGLNRYTLANWRSLRIGPPSIKIGKNIFYRKEALTNWINSREGAAKKEVPRQRKKKIKKKKP